MVQTEASRWSGAQWIDVLLDNCPEASDFRCPLSHVVMWDPVIAEDGCTYERLSIEKWLAEHSTSPLVRKATTGDGGQTFREMGPTLLPNKERKAALDRLLREFDGDGEVEMVTWDAQGLQNLLPNARQLALSSPVSVVPSPEQSPHGVADMTADLTKIFKVLDPLRGELKSLVNLTPPKVVVIGDESAGKSTVLEQLIRMPLFPRKKTFCTRLPIHVRLRRPEVDEQASVTMSVVTTSGYRQSGRDAEPIEPPVTIATANGFHYVQDKMDALEQSLAGETGGVVANRIIVLDVLHPDVPVIDLIDLPGIVTVNVNSDEKRETVERIISEQIAADREAGMTSFYLVIVPAGERPNTNGALKYMQGQKLLDRAIGVFTKADEVRHSEHLVSFVTGEDFEDEDDGSLVTAASLGEVKLAKGWTATMLAMPKLFLKREDGGKVNYYVHHATERLKKQEDDEKQHFGGRDAKPAMRELYDRGLASTGALAAKLMQEYYEYSRGEWLRLTLTRLLEYELELKSQRALLGTTDAVTKDALASAEVARTFDVGAQALSERFVREVLLGTLVPSVQSELDKLAGVSVAVHEVEDLLVTVQAAIEKHVVEGVSAASAFHADELAKLLSAPVKACFDDYYDEAGEEEEEEEGDEGEETKHASSDFLSQAWDIAPGSLADRFWSRGGDFVKSLFGTNGNSLPAQRIELHKQVMTKPIVQLCQYPEFVEAITEVVRAQCVRASERIHVAAARVVAQLTADASLYVRIAPDPSCHNAEIRLVKTSGNSIDFLDALKMAFLRYLPTPAALQGALGASDGLKLSTYKELATARETRHTLDGKVVRVRDAARGLIAALDVDAAHPLDGKWLRALQRENALPKEDPVLPFPGLDKAMTTIFVDGPKPVEVNLMLNAVADSASLDAMNKILARVSGDSGRVLDQDACHGLQNMLGLFFGALVANATVIDVGGLEVAIDSVMDEDLAKHAKNLARCGIPAYFGIAPLALHLKLESEIDETAKYLTLVLEYVAQEVLELSFSECVAQEVLELSFSGSHRSSTMSKEHLERAIRNDEGLDELAVAVTVPQ